MSDNLSCENEYCFNYDNKIFYCNCRICDIRGSASFVNECEANKKFKNRQKNYERNVIKNG